MVVSFHFSLSIFIDVEPFENRTEVNGGNACLHLKSMAETTSQNHAVFLESRFKETISIIFPA